MKFNNENARISYVTPSITSELRKDSCNGSHTLFASVNVYCLCLPQSLSDLGGIRYIKSAQYAVKLLFGAGEAVFFLRPLMELHLCEYQQTSYNKSHQDALYLNFMFLNNSTCFGQTYCRILRSYDC